MGQALRRTFLCGVDQQSGKNYEHRRQWIEDRIRVLSSLFAIDICAFAVMSNHIHLVVKINQEESETWSIDEILSRWTSLFKGPLLVQKWLKQQELSTVEQQMIVEFAELYRKQLTSMSWFMKCLNEKFVWNNFSRRRSPKGKYHGRYALPIARSANKEDNCTGHFYEYHPWY